MSDTDSDLDFESADEETEQDSSEKSNTVSQNVVVSDEKKSTSQVTNISSSDLQNISLNDDGVTSAVTDDEKKDQSVIKTETGTELPKSVLQQEKQRVTLRLEKKLQQKSQLSKESSVEKQKIASSDSSFSIQGENDKKASSWGFSSWGTSLISTAASSVSSFTNQVSQGIGSVIETVESTLGAPAPEDLANITSEKKSSVDLPPADAEVTSDKEPDGSNTQEAEGAKSSESRLNILPDVSAWTKVLEDTSSKVIMGGLDTLELIGKKTIDILTEGDPGLRKKRSAFSEGMTLSQILRQAKVEADEKGENANEDMGSVHYSQIFDEYQGLVHLEALEMLSKQSLAKIQRLLMHCPKNAEIKQRMDEIQSICENIPSCDDPSDPTECENFQDFEPVFKKHVLELNLSFNSDNIIKTQRKIDETIEKYKNPGDNKYAAEEIYREAICNLAEFTAKCIETFHKLAELILVQQSLDPNSEQCATNLTGLTTVMCIEINNLSSRYHSCLESANTDSKNSEITALATNLYVEAANSNKYVQDAYQLLVPVLQVSLLESSE